MKNENNVTEKIEGKFEKFALTLTKFTGSTPAFIIAFVLIIVWGICGPLFDYSDSWQMVINTGTTIITFLMVFLIQRGQNKDSLAIQIKLNEIIASVSGASNRLIDVETLSEKDLEVLRKHYAELSKKCEEEADIKRTHSIEEAIDKHNIKFSN